MISLKVKYLSTTNPCRCYACERPFEEGTRMKVEIKDDNEHVYLCATCDALVKLARPLFVDDDELVCAKGCVANLIKEYNLASPEHLQTHLKNELVRPGYRF